MCTALLPPAGYPTAVNKYMASQVTLDSKFWRQIVNDLPCYVRGNLKFKIQRGTMGTDWYNCLSPYFLCIHCCYSEYWVFLRSSWSSCTPAQISQLSVWTPCRLPRWWSTQSAEIGLELQSSLFPRQHVLHVQPVIIRKAFDIIIVLNADIIICIK